MATLRKHGIVLAEAVHETDGNVTRMTPEEVLQRRLGLTNWERETRRLMSDGVILVKHDVRFNPSPFDSDQDVKAGGRRHSYGWKLAGKIDLTVRTPKEWADKWMRRGYGVRIFGQLDVANGGQHDEAGQQSA